MEISIKPQKKLYDKFINAYEVDEYEVLTPNGYINIEGVGKTILFDEYEILTYSGKELICADTHIIGRCDNIDFIKKTYDLTEIYVKDLKIDDYIITVDGPEKILFVLPNGKKSHMYDLQISKGSDKHYFTNGIVSHNSCQLQNFGVNVANAGYVVAYVTLELSEKKSLKRIGSMRLEIPISEYNEIAKDKEFMKRKITEMNEKYGNMFSQSNGKIYIKEYPSGMAGVMDIENYVKLVYELTGKKIDFLIVDYIQIMKPDQSLKIDNMLYLKGKHLAEGLRAIASKYDLVCLTATQISKEKYNANDIILSDLPESKAIADTADTVQAIIQTLPMKLDGKYHLKPLKLRDNDTIFDRVGFEFNKKYLRVHSDYGIEHSI